MTHHLPALDWAKHFVRRNTRWTIFYSFATDTLPIAKISIIQFSETNEDAMDTIYHGAGTLSFDFIRPDKITHWPAAVVCLFTCENFCQPVFRWPHHCSYNLPRVRNSGVRFYPVG